MKQYNKSIRGKLFLYFKQRIGLKKSTKGWHRTDCKYCGGYNTMGIHLQKNSVHCFKCGEKVSPIKLLMDLQDFTTYTEAWKFLSIQQEYEAYSDTISSKTIISKPVELPETFTLINQGENIFAKAARAYLLKRGFRISALALRGVGYCTGGKYMGYIIFPFYKKGILIYFQGRKFMELGPKMKNPEDGEFGIGKSQVIYNEDALYIYNRIHVVESITNSLTLGDNSIALLGKKASDWQMTSILKSPCEKISLILDPDAWEEAVQLALALVHYKKIKITKLPESMDVNDLGKNKTLELVKKEPYKKYMELFKLRIDYGKNPVTSHQRVGPYYSSTRGVA